MNNAIVASYYRLSSTSLLHNIMKRSCQPEPNHIDKLPEKLVCEILIRLPIRDAVRTSLLSKKWRYSWTKLPRIVFNDTSCDGLIMKTESKTIMAIYQVLLLHHGPLDSFKLSFSNLGSFPEIDQFLRVVLRGGTRDLTLAMPKDKPYVLPSSIIEYGQQLEILSLCYCVFKPPTRFTGFSKLVKLELQEVGISGNTLSSLISKCSLLEHLLFTSYANCGRLDLVAPTLKTFSFVGLCDSLCFTNTPKLITVLIATYDNYYIKEHAPKEIKPPSQCMLCGRLPFIRNLILDSPYSKYMTSNIEEVPPLVNDLCRLETLCLWPMCFGFIDEVSSALCLVKYSKNLKKLTINVRTESSASNLDLRNVDGLSDVTLDHLQEFEFSYFSGSRCELQLIKLILARSPMMKKCFMRPDAQLVGEKRLKFYEELSRFRRASPHVNIIYTYSDEDKLY